MLLHLLSCLLLIPILVSWGALFLVIFGFNSEKISTHFMVGVAGITLSSAVLAFVLPMNSAVELFYLLGGIGLFFYFKMDLLFSKSHLFKDLNFWSIFFGCLFVASFAPFLLDHFGYYVPSIQWIKAFGWVQGVANIDLVLGQMSFWHLFQSVFSHISDPYLRMNSVLLIGFVIYIFEKKSYYLLCFFPYFFFFTQSPSVDLPTNCFALILLNEVFRKNKNWVALFALSVFTFILKPTLLWCPIWVFLILISHRVSVKNYLLGGFVFALFILKNLYIFAFPFFPIFKFGIATDYTTNAVFAEQSDAFAVQKTFDMQYSLAEIKSFDWVEFLWKWLTIEGYKSLIHFAFLLSVVVVFFIAVRKNKKYDWFLWIAIIIKSVFVLVFSAQFRFFIDVIFVALFLLFYQFEAKKIYFAYFLISFIGFVILFLKPNQISEFLPRFRLSKSIIGFQKSQWKEPVYFLHQPYTTHQLGNLKFHTPSNYPYNYNTKLVAISQPKLELFLKLGLFPQEKENSSRIFVWKKLDETQKIRLNAILKQLNLEEKNKKKH